MKRKKGNERGQMMRTRERMEEKIARNDNDNGQC